jgi:hypothetical protein
VKTAVVLSFARGASMFRHDLLDAPESVRFVLIVSDRELSTVPADSYAYFDRVHAVPCGVQDPEPMDYSVVDPDAARAALREVLRETGSDEVTLHCFDEIMLLFAAELRAEFGIPGPGPEQIRLFRDKCLMKERLVAAGVRVPAFGRFDVLAAREDVGGYFRGIVEEVGLPFILKPVDAAGSLGVHRVGSAEEFAALVPGVTGGYEYEEFVAGTMYSVNQVSQNGRTIQGGVTEYLVNTLDVAHGKVNADINLDDSDPRVARMVAFADAALDALGRPDGATHLELFHTAADELVFLEVAARFKGLAGLAAMERNYGTALVNLAMEVESGLTSRPYDGTRVPCFDAVIPLRPGTVAELFAPDIRSEFEISWKVAAGDVVEGTDSLFSTGATFLVWNEDYSVLYEDFQRLADYRPIRYQTAGAGV